MVSYYYCVNFIQCRLAYLNATFLNKPDPRAGVYIPLQRIATDLQNIFHYAS
jgi:hypothetical protein